MPVEDAVIDDQTVLCETAVRWISENAPAQLRIGIWGERPPLTNLQRGAVLLSNAGPTYELLALGPTRFVIVNPRREAEWNSAQAAATLSKPEINCLLHCGLDGRDEFLQGLRTNSQWQTLPFPGLPAVTVAWKCDNPLNDFADQTLAISLPARVDRRRLLLWNFILQGIRFEFFDGIRPGDDEILWREMRHMEAYKKIEYLRGSYIPGAVGCKRSAIAAFQRFLQTEGQILLLVQDDCQFDAGSRNILQQAFNELPTDWEMLYLAASCRSPSKGYSKFWTKLQGARHCTSILFKRSFIEQVLPQLIDCGSELDVFFEQTHRNRAAFCVLPMVARQSPGFSDITLTRMSNPNALK